MLLAEERDVARTADGDGLLDRPWVIVAGLFLIVQLWLAMAPTSLWLDETETWWIVKDGAAETLRRAVTSSGQSPFYYLIAGLSWRWLGMNEIALRIPSMLAMAGAAYFVYRIAQRLLDRTTATAAAFVFICSGAYYAVDARPYALALLCMTCAAWMLLRWIDSRSLIDGALYVLASALLVYAHPFLAVSLGSIAGVAVFVLRKEIRRLIWLAGFEVTAALLCVPVFVQLGTMFATRASHTVPAAHPQPDDLLRGIVPCAVPGALVIGIWLIMMYRREARIPNAESRNALFIGAWSVVAPASLFLLAISSRIWLYLPRYYLSALPAQAILVGALLCSIKRPEVRRALIAAIAAVAIMVSGRLAGKSHGGEDWRDAMALLRQEAGSAPVLLVSGFAEASDFQALEDSGKRPFFAPDFFAPELLYGMPRRNIRLPITTYGADAAHMEKIVSELRKEPRFYLVTENPDGTWQMWLHGRMSGEGRTCRSEATGSRFGSLWILRFTCE